MTGKKIDFYVIIQQLDQFGKHRGLLIMRLFGRESDGSSKEFIRTPLQSNYKESVLEGWLENNPDGIVEDGKLLINGLFAPVLINN